MKVWVFSRFDSKTFIFIYLIKKIIKKLYTQQKNRKLISQYVYENMGIAELFRVGIAGMLLHNVKQHNVNVTWRDVTKRSCTQRKSSKT
jgi:hypothetical protein